MAFMRMLGIGALGLVGGCALGAGGGLLGGLGYTSLAGVSGFEGYSGYVVGAWLLVGALLGAAAGPFLAIGWDMKRRSPPRRHP